MKNLVIVTMAATLCLLDNTNADEPLGQVIQQSGNSGRIETKQSGTLGLPTDEYHLIHYSGTWGNEFVVERTKLTPGTKSIEVRTFREMKSPQFAIRPHGKEDTDKGSVWFGGLKASCNWRMDFPTQSARRKS